MTWPFENDTSGIVKRISNRSISANRKRNIFIVLTIVLASTLISDIVLYGFGVMQETQNRNQKTAQIMYHAISEQQGQELYKQEEIAWVGEFFNAFSENRLLCWPTSRPATLTARPAPRCWGLSSAPVQSSGKLL